MLLAYQEDDPCALHVEAARHVQDGVLDDFLNARMWDRDGFVESVDGAARGHDVEEGFGVTRGRHLDCW